MFNKIFSRKKIGPPLSKEELVERLKALAADETPKMRNMGAMCYSIAQPPAKQTLCDFCHCIIHYWGREDIIKAMVGDMKMLGYDVKVRIVCPHCAQKTEAELLAKRESQDEDNYKRIKDMWPNNIYHIFYIKVSPDIEYHRVIENDPDKYRTLLALLENRPMFSGNFGKLHYVDEEIEILEHMTGIKFDV